MKKLVSIFVLAIFVGCPMVGRADPVALDPQPTPTNPTHTNSNNATDILPGYASTTVYDVDQSGVASAAYVKGAYNEAIRSVNKVAAIADSKQAPLKSSGNDANVLDDPNNSGDFVTTITANDGTVTVSKVEVSVPIANSAPTVGNGRAAIWIQ